jgi:hypothetical protein
VTSSERRYRRWLRFYPEEYRRARGEEILTTLLDTASERARIGDLLHVAAHGVWMRSRVIARRSWAGKLPRTVYVATLVMAILAVFNLLNAAFPQNGPKNPSSHIDNIIVGFALIGLALLLRTWSRRLYPAVLGALICLVAMSFVVVDLLYDVLAVIPLVLLVIGTRPYTAALPETLDPSQGPQRVV